MAAITSASASARAALGAATSSARASGKAPFASPRSMLANRHPFAVAPGASALRMTVRRLEAPHSARRASTVVVRASGLSIDLRGEEDLPRALSTRFGSLQPLIATCCVIDSGKKAFIAGVADDQVRGGGF